MRRFLSLFTSKPTPPPQVLDVAAAKRRADKRQKQIVKSAQRERENALFEYHDAVSRKQTQRQNKAAKRVRRATDRCLELGV